MVKIKYNVKGADHAANAAGGGDYVKPPKGVYIARLVEANLDYSKDKDGNKDKSRPRIECIYQIVGESDGSKPEVQYNRLWDYVSFSEAAEWKLDQFLQAVGVETSEDEEGELNLLEYAGSVTDHTKKGSPKKEGKTDGKLVKVRVTHEKDDRDEDGFRARVGGVFRLVDEDAEALDEELDEALSDDESEDEPEVEEWEDEEEESDDEPELTAEDIDNLTPAELKALVKEHGIKVKKGMKVGAVRDLVKDELGLNDDDDEDAPF